MSTIWELVKKSINYNLEFECFNPVISRKEIIDSVSKEYINSTKVYVNASYTKTFSESTVDNFRNMLTVVGCLKKTKVKGVFKIIMKIPDSYTTTDLYNDYIKIKSK